MSEATAGKAANYCDDAGMDAKDPLRLALVSIATSADQLKASAEKVGKEAGQRAAQAAATEIRTVAPKIVREAVGLKWAALAGLVAVSAGMGWFAGRHMPVAMSLGRMTPAQAETVRWNDLGALLNGCQAQPPTSGRDWCMFSAGWWQSPPPAAPK